MTFVENAETGQFLFLVVLHLFMTLSIFELLRHHHFFLNDNPHFFVLFLIDLPTA
jgi:hypothetical protein